MNIKQEIVDSIEIMVDSALKKICPIITFGVIMSIDNRNRCTVKINNIDYKITYYGKNAPDVMQKYPVFIPFGKMNLAFVMTSGGDGGEGGTTDYNQLSNRPSINSVVLSGNKTADNLNLQSKLSSSQSLAVDSGITTEKVRKYDGYEQKIEALDIGCRVIDGVICVTWEE